MYNYFHYYFFVNHFSLFSLIIPYLTHFIFLYRIQLENTVHVNISTIIPSMMQKLSYLDLLIVLKFQNLHLNYYKNFNLNFFLYSYSEK